MLLFLKMLISADVSDISVGRVGLSLLGYSETCMDFKPEFLSMT